jgi:hypothetical protein
MEIELQQDTPEVQIKQLECHVDMKCTSGT